jgi:hypothetical protein
MQTVKKRSVKILGGIAAAVLLYSFVFKKAPESINDFYTVADIDIPGRVYPEIGGLALMPNGNIAACFHRGEVMIYNPKTKAWKMFAQGLHDPLGLAAISNNELLVPQRAELTRLVDKNKDGVAEDYITVTDEWGLSGNYCEFTYGPVKDKKGNMYMSLNTASNGDGVWKELRGEFSKGGKEGRMYSAVPYRGWVMKLSPDGKITPYALGFRSPNGLGIDKDDNIWITDNQGDWLGSSKMYHVEEGKFYGHAPSLAWRKGWDPNVTPINVPVKTLDSMRTKEAIVFPHGDISHSPTQMQQIPAAFGPYGGQMLVGEMDYPRLIRVMVEKVKGAFQGACIPFLDSAGLTRGNERLLFTADGKSLYVGKTAYTWVGGNGLQRIDFKGGVPMDVLNMNLTQDGFKLTFTRPLAHGVGSVPQDYKFTNYYYEYHQAYGSNKFGVKEVKVTGVKVSADRKEAYITLDKLQPGYVYYLQLDKRVASEDGMPLANKKLWYTLNNTL